jgi:ProP effector
MLLTLATLNEFLISMDKAAPSHFQVARALLKELQEKYPVLREVQPLAIGIDKQLIAQQPEINRKALRIALGIHTNSIRYLKAMKKASNRFDLEGKPAGDVTEEQRAHASAMLEERLKKDAELRKVQRQAELERKKEEEAVQRRAEKLNQLAAKFSRTR